MKQSVALNTDNVTWKCVVSHRVLVPSFFTGTQKAVCVNCLVFGLWSLMMVAGGCAPDRWRRGALGPGGPYLIIFSILFIIAFMIAEVYHRKYHRRQNSVGFISTLSSSRWLSRDSHVTKVDTKGNAWLVKIKEPVQDGDRLEKLNRWNLEGANYSFYLGDGKWSQKLVKISWPLRGGGSI